MSHKIFVSPDGNNSNIGTETSPLKSLNMALYKIREKKKNDGLPDGGISVILRNGYYFLDSPLVLDEQDSGERDKPIVFQAYEGEEAIISGGIQLELDWTPFRDGIFQSKVSGDFSIDRLFVNGKLQSLARYPNYDPDAKFFHGTSPDAINPERVKKWKNPVGGMSMPCIRICGGANIIR